ncbi:hypothetical protein HYALB_00001261 [Hymenoscyphus albidus]|uniref:Uncharacterized protein n=1 Tax=Hymenoscyphus albidus TaxID=595503 RepID=A0A9N9Q2Y1_9HELO|nr:hypothetical protein HYALB_00001261 [Hymenoscyphus albidus]
MSNPNLPAGFSFITVKGKQCTAIPKVQAAGAGGGGGGAQPPAAQNSTSVASTTTSTTSSTTAPATTSTPPPPPPPPPPPVAIPPPATSPPVAIPPPPTAAPPAIPPPTAVPISEIPPTTSAPPPPPPATTPPAIVPPITPTQTPIPLPKATPKPPPSKPTPVPSPPVVVPQPPPSKTPAPTESPAPPVAVPQSDPPAKPTLLGSLPKTTLSTARATNPAPKGTFPPSTPIPDAAAGGKGPTDGGISSGPRTGVGPVIGGVFGAFALFALFAFLIFFIMRRRRKRDSLLTPLGTGTRDEFYRDEKSGGPMSTFDNDNDEKWTARERLKATAVGLQMGLVGIGAKLKKTMTSRSDSLSVNLNRGNSQFLDGPVPTHSRNSSIYSNVQGPGFKDKATEWWANFRRQHMTMLAEPEDPFVAARFANERKAQQLSNPSPDFSQLLGMDDRELQLQADRRSGTGAESRSSLPSIGSLGSLGLNFKPLQDPFADPKPNMGYDSRSNPFADPISPPRPSISKPNNYVTNVRRSRGLSINNDTAAPASRYPSTLAPSRDSYRDTVFSAFTSTTRRGKGRSDPFDLERPDLWRRTNNPNFDGPAVTGHSRAPSLTGGDGMNLYPVPIIPPNQNPASAYTQPLGDRVKSNATYESKYSSGVDSLDGWGDPGPDLGPGSGGSSLKSSATAPGKAR